MEGMMNPSDDPNVAKLKPNGDLEPKPPRKAQFEKTSFQELLRQQSEKQTLLTTCELSQSLLLTKNIKETTKYLHEQNGNYHYQADYPEDCMRQEDAIRRANQLVNIGGTDKNASFLQDHKN